MSHSLPVFNLTISPRIYILLPSQPIVQQGSSEDLLAGLDSQHAPFLDPRRQIQDNLRPP
jgi:hypothetical protein